MLEYAHSLSISNSIWESSRWSPRKDIGLLIWLLAGYGMTLDVDGKVMYWDAMGGGPRVTFLVRPLPGANANFGGKTTLNMAGGCFGTAPIPSTGTCTVLAVGSTASGNAAIVSMGTSLAEIYAATSTRYANMLCTTNYASTYALTAPSIIVGRFNGSSSKLYTHAKTPANVSIGTPTNNTTVGVGGHYTGIYLWNGTIASISITTTKTDAIDASLLDYSAKTYALTLGA
jgi:hypothetical protein